MILDKKNIFCENQVITESAASENFINQEEAGDAYGSSELFLVISTTDAFTGATSMEIALQTDDNSSFSSPKILFSTGVILEASLTANTVLAKVRLPKGLEKYIRLYMTVDGTHSKGKLNAFITPDVSQFVDQK